MPSHTYTFKEKFKRKLILKEILERHTLRVIDNYIVLLSRGVVCGYTTVDCVIV